MPRALRILILVVLAPIAIAVWGTVVFAMDRASNQGEVLGEVTVSGIPLGGLNEDEARLAILQLEYDLATQPIQVHVEDATFELFPYEVGYTLDRETMLDEALANGREGGLRSQFGWWLRHFTGEAAAVDVIASVDTSWLDPHFQRWQDEAIAAPPFEGAVFIENGQPKALYPRTGVGIDREGTTALIESALLDPARPEVTVLTSTIQPTTPTAVIDAAAEEARALVAGPVTLSTANPPASIEIPTRVLQDALQSEALGVANRTIVLSFSPEPLLEYIEPRRAGLEFPALDAEIVIRPDDTPSIIPGRSSMVVDETAIPGAVMAAARSVTRSAVLPYEDGDEPEFSTEDAEALGITELLYRATTFFPCCGDQKNLNRINNIHLIADAVDGVILLPDEVFSLNEHVGPRTEEKGYARAGAIIGPEVYCCDNPANVGGGVSQFTTTLYNTVFFSGLEDIKHTPHTLYFSRYPEGREATLGYPEPDLVFKNNTEHALYIKTWHTDDSVSVEFYGDNGGIEVTARLSERCCFTEPEDLYKPDDTLDPDEEDVDDEGSNGWTVTSYRDITYPDGTTTTQEWAWRYHPFPRVILVHPCMLPEDHDDYDASIVCPVQVPEGLFGSTAAEAQAAIQAAQLVYVGDTKVTGDPALVGKVVEVGPGGGTWVQPWSEVTIKIGVAPEAGGEEG